MKTSKEGKLINWNNNRMSSSIVMLKNHHRRRRRVKKSPSRIWKTTEELNHESMNTEGKMMKKKKKKKMIWNNNNRLMSCCSSSSPMILKRRNRYNEKMMDDDDLIIGKATMTTTTTTISDLPQELLAQEVLVRLSLKDIRACVCVQKSWLSLIKTRMFVTLYSNYRQTSSSSSSPDNYTKYLLFKYKFVSGGYELRVDDIQCEKYLTLKSPPDQTQFDNFFNRLVSNGLICIYEYTDKTDHDIYLWNPVIQKHKTLPRSPHRPYHITTTLSKAIGFGFVPETNDYVVVFIVKYGCWSKRHTHSCVTCVYSLNTNSWREITNDHVPDVLEVNDLDSFFVNGVAVWAGFDSEENDTKRIICFDTKTDMLREILLPECINRDTFTLTIHPLGESVVCFARGEFDYNKVGMWVLKGDMMNEFLWEKKVTFRFPKYAPVHALGPRNNGDPILCNSYDMVSYNLDSYKLYDLVTSWDRWTPYRHRYRWRKEDNLCMPFVIKPFVESLALLNID